MSYLCGVFHKISNKMKSIQTLSFSQLEEEMEALKEQDAQSCVGGGWFDYVHDLDEVVIYGPPIRGGGGGVGLFPNDFSPGYEDYENYGGAGGGYTPEETPPEPGPPLKLKNLPGMCEQVAGTGMCGIFALDYISKFYGGDKMGIHKSDFAEVAGINNIPQAFEAFFSKNIGIDGVQYNNIINTFFRKDETTYSSGLSQITESLKSDHPIVCVYGDYNPTTNSVDNGHAVVIVGYNPSTNQLTIADSLSNGGIREIDYNAAKFYELNTIIGMKDKNEIDPKYLNNKDWWKGCGIGK
jgi:hypothetical protein